MKKTQTYRWAGLVALIVTAVAPTIWAALSPEVSDAYNGQEAPEFSGHTVKGDSVALKDWKGHVVLVNFFASWCPPCRSEIGQLSQLHGQYSKQGLAVIGFAVDAVETPDTVGDVAPLAKKLSIPYPVAIATEKIGKDYHFKGIPTTVVIDRDGKIAKTFYGYHDGKVIEAAVQKLLSPAESKG